MKVSVPEYAAAEGISIQAAHKRLNRLGIKVKRGQTIDAAVVNAKWAQVQNPAQAAKNPGGVKKTEKPEPRAAEPIAKRDDSLAEAQRAKEWLAVAERKLKVEREQGKLIERSEVMRLLGDMIVTAKTNLRGLGAKLAADLSVETNAAKCQAMIDAEIDEALQAISKWQPPSKPSVN